jgi:hypothetical protein
MLLSLAISLFLVSIMIKFYSLQETLHTDIQTLSQLNRQAVIARQIFVNEIEFSQGLITILDSGHKLEINHKIFYTHKNNLYSKKNNDFAVELVPNIKNFSAKKVNNIIELNFTVFIREKSHETQRIHINNSLNIHFFVKFNRALEPGNSSQ